MSLMMVSMLMMILTRSIACARRIVEVLDEQPQITDGPGRQRPDRGRRLHPL